MRKAVWFGLAVLVVGIGAVTMGWLRGPKPIQVETVQVALGDLSLVANAEAFVRGKTFEVGTELPGRIVELSVAEGQTVPAGVVLFRLDGKDLQAQVDQAQASSATAAAMVTETIRARDAAVASWQSRLAQAKAQVREAEARLRDAERGARPEAIEVARHEVERLLALEREMRRRLDRAERLYAQGATSKAAVDAARTDYEAAVAQREAADDALAQVQRGPLPETADAARAQLEAARAGLELAESGRREIEFLTAQVRTAQARMAEATAQVRHAATAARKAEVRAPVAGTIVRVQGDLGTVAVPGQPVIVLSTRADLHIEAEVQGEDLDLFQPGTLAEITQPSAQARALRGRVESLAAVAEPKPNAALRSRIVRTRIRILDDARFLVPGMEVDVTVRVLRRGVLVVPNSAVAFDGETPSVWRVVAGVAKRQSVRLGAGDAERSEIVEGLAQGDVIVLNPPEALTEGARVKLR